MVRHSYFEGCDRCSVNKSGFFNLQKMPLRFLEDDDESVTPTSGLDSFPILYITTYFNECNSPPLDELLKNVNQDLATLFFWGAGCHAIGMQTIPQFVLERRVVGEMRIRMLTRRRNRRPADVYGPVPDMHVGSYDDL